jgi:hypothetical protein
MSVATLKYIVLGLLLLFVIWLVRIIVKRETENLVRALVLAVACLGIFLFLQNQKAEEITLADIKDQIK